MGRHQGNVPVAASDRAAGGRRRRGASRERETTLRAVRTFPRTLASTGEVIDFADGFTSAAAVSERAAFVARIVAEELFTNFLLPDAGGTASPCAASSRPGRLGVRIVHTLSDNLE